MPYPPKPKRPADLRDLKLTARDYRMIGEIIIVCGLIEGHMRLAPMRLLGERRHHFLALTAHMNFRSLCDTTMSLLDDCVPDERARESYRQAIQLAVEVYDRRNVLAHGPFMAGGDGKRYTINFSARGRLKPKIEVFGETALAELLDACIGGYDLLLKCDPTRP